MNGISSELIVAVIVAVVSTVAAIFALSQIQERLGLGSRRYDAERSRALLDEMRADFERQLYRLSERMTATEARWLDINHLIVSSQRAQNIEERTGKKVHLSNFLRSTGFAESDLEIDKELVFVLTPFNDQFRPVFDAIREVCLQSGLKCMRGDEQYVQGDLLRHVLRGLVRANVVIACVGGRNPNVFYELGLAHAMDKGVILVSQTTIDLPVDVRSNRIVVFQALPELQAKLKDELLKLLVSDKTK